MYTAVGLLPRFHLKLAARLSVSQLLTINPLMCTYCASFNK